MRPLTVRRRPPKGLLATFTRATKKIARMLARENAKPPYWNVKRFEMRAKNRLKSPHIKGFRDVDDGPPKHLEAVRKAKVTNRVRYQHFKDLSCVNVISRGHHRKTKNKSSIFYRLIP